MTGPAKTTGSRPAGQVSGTRHGPRKRGSSEQLPRRAHGLHGGPGDRGGLFAGYVAHELRTPLATQRALLELLLADPNADAAAWREVGEDVLHACMQQERVLDACLTLSQSQCPLRRRETLDLAHVAAEVIRRHDLRGLQITLRLGHAFVAGDRDLIERLLTNLLSNAVCHNRRDGWIKVATRSDDDRSLFTIENAGAPIRAAQIPRLFEPFRQLGPRTTASTGVGLGLAVVKAVAEAHDGAVTARPLGDGGLRVEVGFPAPATDGSRRARNRR